MIAWKFSAYAYTHARPHPRKGRGGNWKRRKRRKEKKKERIPDGLSIVGVYLKTVLQVAIETHK